MTTLAGPEQTQRSAAWSTQMAARIIDQLCPDIGTDTAVLQSTLSVLANRGTRATTMTSIAAAAGISGPTLFRRYGSKGDLQNRAIRFAFADLLSRIGHVFTTDADPRHQLTTVGASCLRLGAELLACSYDARHATDILAAVATGEPSVIDHVRSYITLHLNRQQYLGRIPIGDAELQADALVRIMLGHPMIRSSRDRSADAAQAYDFIDAAWTPIVLRSEPENGNVHHAPGNPGGSGDG